MIKPDDLDFLAQREARARYQAATSKDGSARIAHLAPADGYAALASTAKRDEPVPSPQSNTPSLIA